MRRRLMANRPSRSARTEVTLQAHDGEEAVGLLRVSVSRGARLVHPTRYGFITSAFVRASHRRRGVLRLLLAEGELGGAERQLTPLSRNVRLGPAQRAQAFHYLAQVARQTGDAEAAARLQAQAAALAPGSVFASAMAPTLASATATATTTAAATLADAAAPLG